MTLLSADRASVVAVPDSSSVGQQVVSRVCARRLCTVVALEESEFCDEHARQKRQYDAAWIAKRRAGWAKAKRCTNCGAAKRKRGSVWCAACVIRDGRIKISSVGQQVVGRAERVAAATAIDRDGRSRYHGTGKKGRRSIQEENAADFDLVEKELAKLIGDAIVMVPKVRGASEYVWSSEAQQQPRIQREETRQRALGRVHVAYRLLGEILRRGRHPCAPQIADSDDPDDT